MSQVSATHEDTRNPLVFIKLSVQWDYARTLGLHTNSQANILTQKALGDRSRHEAFQFKIIVVVKWGVSSWLLGYTSS